MCDDELFLISSSSFITKFWQFNGNSNTMTTAHITRSHTYHYYYIKIKKWKTYIFVCHQQCQTTTFKIIQTPICFIQFQFIFFVHYLVYDHEYGKICWVQITNKIVFGPIFHFYFCIFQVYSTEFSNHIKMMSCMSITCKFSCFCKRVLRWSHGVPVYG